MQTDVSSLSYLTNWKCLKFQDMPELNWHNYNQAICEGGLFVKGRGSLKNYLVIKLTKFRGGKSSTDYKTKIEQEK